MLVDWTIHLYMPGQSYVDKLCAVIPALTTGTNVGYNHLRESLCFTKFLYFDFTIQKIKQYPQVRPTQSMWNGIKLINWCAGRYFSPLFNRLNLLFNSFWWQAHAMWEESWSFPVKQNPHAPRPGFELKHLWNTLVHSKFNHSETWGPTSKFQSKEFKKNLSNLELFSQDLSFDSIKVLNLGLWDYSICSPLLLDITVTYTPLRIWFDTIDINPFNNRPNYCTTLNNFFHISWKSFQTLKARLTFNTYPLIPITCEFFLR